MGSMMSEGMACGMAMMIGMGVVAILLTATLLLTMAAAIKYLRSGSLSSDRISSLDNNEGIR